MKNSKLIDVFKCGNITIPLYLLKNIDKLNLKMDEFVFLMYIYNLGNTSLFNPNKYCDELGIGLDEVMNYISVLTDKGLIKVDVLKNDKGLMEEVILLDDFYNKITLLTISNCNETDKSSDSNIFELIEKEFGRTLSSIEYEIINAWLDNNFDETLIKEALKEAVFNGVSNLKYMDKILYEWSKVGVKTVTDVEELRKKRNVKNDKAADIDLEIVDWNWFDDDDDE